jgi:nucleoside-diphosphate-sugar epimerase
MIIVNKRCVETLFFDYRRQHGMEIKVARIFNTYGPSMHMNDGRVVYNFILQALQGKSITVLDVCQGKFKVATCNKCFAG